jgi:predicted FMN-binding regulatory protein PaiB
MYQHNSSSKKLTTKVSQNQIEKEKELPQKIKELVMAPPELIESMPDGIVKQEVKKLRNVAREEGAEA